MNTAIETQHAKDDPTVTETQLAHGDPTAFETQLRYGDIDATDAPPINVAHATETSPTATDVNHVYGDAMFYNEFGTQSSATETQPIENTQHATKTKLMKKNPKKKLKVVALNKRTNDRFRTLKTKSFKGSWEIRNEPLMILEDEDDMLTKKTNCGGT